MSSRFGSGASFVITKDTLTPNLNEFDDDFDRVLHSAVEYRRPQTEAYMRNNAPWTDQTGNARSGLRAESVHAGDEHGIHVFHTVPYGIWLEVRFEGRFAIIEPTVKAEGEALMNDVQGLFGKMH